MTSYLAGRGVSVAPDRVLLTTSHLEGYELLLRTLCGAGDEILLPCLGDAITRSATLRRATRVVNYGVTYDGEWRLDSKSVARAVTRRTRVIVLGNPLEPTGAMLSRGDLAFLEDLCVSRRIALVADERALDTSSPDHPSVLEAIRSLVFHLSGIAAVSGVQDLHAEWMAVAGPDELVQPALSALGRALDELPPVAERIQRAMPALLARRERFLVPLRARLAENRAALAKAALAEAPWTLEWGRAGCWGVLHVAAIEDEESLCLSLLEEDGVAVVPGFLHGFAPNGYVVVSLLTPPDTFRRGLSLLDRRLRAPLFA